LGYDELKTSLLEDKSERTSRYEEKSGPTREKGAKGNWCGSSGVNNSHAQIREGKKK